MNNMFVRYAIITGFSTKTGLHLFCEKTQVSALQALKVAFHNTSHRLANFVR